MTDISVIVPAHNAATTLSRTLSALRAQSFSGDYEIIVVDDGSVDTTAALAQRAGARLIRNERAQGPAQARNAGRRAARGALLAFTDADCEPAPDWLARGSAAAESADLVQGSVRPTPGADVGPFDRTLRVEAQSPRLYETANLFVSAEVFDRVGGFRALTELGGGGKPVIGMRPGRETEHFGEDVLFATEARRLGARFVFDHQITVAHAVFRRGARGAIRERWRLRYMPTLVREAPEMRSDLMLGVFLSERTARFDLAVTGLACAIASRRREPLLLAVPYLAMLRRRGLWRRSAWRENLGLVTVDATACAALICGSAAARRIVI